tara:strand:- start:740 stop:952 length:213 start_codon:yes stop_codon:yes gene_type:complete
VRNSRFKNNIAKKSARRRVVNFIRKKFAKVENLTIDEYDAAFTITPQQDEWDRHDRHMFPIREAQKHNDN